MVHDGTVVFPERRRPHAGIAFLLACAIGTLGSARFFYGYMLQQTGGEWSAPLDDVFIHFDYARATARGFPFQWSEGNGYSSGGTSVLYPLVLAVGYWLGFRGPSLMIWAAMIAASSVLGLLWSCGRLFRGMPAWTTVFVLPCFFSVGALMWTLWSGMEVAFFLGVWAIGLALAVDLADRRTAPRRGALSLGLAGAVIVLTRPEAATSVAALGVFAALAVGRRQGFSLAPGVLVRAGLPAAIALAAQALVNRVLTGETAANGAIVKLALYNPYLTSAEKYADWRSNIDYAIDRLTLHHFGEVKPWGWVPVWLALLPLLDRRTRGVGALLWASIVLWVMTVALNGQVRWQNERYLMPAVTWLLLLAALGLAVVAAPAADALWRRPRQVVGALALSWLVLQFWRGERVQYRDQVWFFARASRNIRDQHTTAGRLLGKLDPAPRRVLVGDAGALLYASDLPGFDLIGLGGYKKLPLARAGVHGVAATLELMERVPPAERPEVMAIYPSWWPSLPQWFGEAIFAVPVRGNVICGGAEKVIYRADWHLLGSGDHPRSLAPGERIVDEVDVADLVSEKEHGYVFPRPAGGFATMRVLPDPRERERDMWDAGRRIPLGRGESFRLPRAPLGRALRLLVRTALDRDTVLDVRAGAFSTRLELAGRPGWLEVPIELPAAVVKPDLEVTLTPFSGEWTDYHVWALTAE